LNGNKIKTLESSLLEHLHRLHTFSASWNQIRLIEKSFFVHNYDLRWIYLAKNNLENLEIDFRKIRKLRAVDLRKNLGDCNFSFNINFTNQSTIEIFQGNVTQFCRVNFIE
jgi:Leucine-rich repeat (LRR) protein